MTAVEDAMLFPSEYWRVMTPGLADLEVRMIFENLVWIN